MDDGAIQWGVNTRHSATWLLRDARWLDNSDNARWSLGSSREVYKDGRDRFCYSVNNWVHYLARISNISTEIMSGRGKLEKPEPRPSLAHPVLVCSFQSVGFIAFFARETMPRGLGLGHQSTWPQSWSTWQPKSWNWLAMLPGITRSHVSSHAIFSWQCATTKSSTSYWAAWP